MRAETAAEPTTKSENINVGGVRRGPRKRRWRRLKRSSGHGKAPERSNQISLFIRDEKTGRHAFNPKALKALGVDPAAARERGYPLKESEETESNLAA